MSNTKKEVDTKKSGLAWFLLGLTPFLLLSINITKIYLEIALGFDSIPFLMNKYFILVSALCMIPFLIGFKLKINADDKDISQPFVFLIFSFMLIFLTAWMTTIKIDSYSATSVLSSVDIKIEQVEIKNSELKNTTTVFLKTDNERFKYKTKDVFDSFKVGNARKEKRTTNDGRVDFTYVCQDKKCFKAI